MKDIVQESVYRYRILRQNSRRYIAVLLVLAILTSMAVHWKLRVVGISMTADYNCGFDEEHTHQEECWSVVHLCGLRNSVEGDSDLWGERDALQPSLVAVYDGEGKEVGTATLPEQDDAELLTIGDGVEEQAASESDPSPDTAADSETMDVAEAVPVEEVPDQSGSETLGTDGSDNIVTKIELSPSTIGPSDEDAATTESTAFPTAGGGGIDFYIRDVSLADHEHDDSCTFRLLTCGKEEHRHTANCYVDLTADVETASDWEATLPLTRTGVWATDLANVAVSQLGYTESERNFSVSDGDTKGNGYTRYGAWYGEDFVYVDWDYAFVAFCLTYAGVDETVLPVRFSSAQMLREQIGGLAGAEYYGEDVTAVQPKQGDILLYTTMDGETTIGIVTSASQNDAMDIADTEQQNGIQPAQTSASSFIVISGDVDGTVAEVSVSLGDIIAMVDVTAAYEAFSALAGEVPNPSAAQDALSLDEMGGITWTKNVETTADGPVANGLAVNMAPYIVTATFQKKNGILWEDATEFTTDDQVRSTISFDGVYTSALQANNNTIYIDLPAGIDCDKFTGEYETKDGSVHSGVYHFEQNEDGTWRIVLVLDEAYVASAGDTIGGNLQFEYQWTKDAVEESGQTEVKIGNWYGYVTVRDGSGGEQGSGDYGINKSAGELYYGDDGKTAYIDYTVTLTVHEDMEAPVELKDVLTGDGFDYDTGSLSVEGDGINANFSSTVGGTSTTIQMRPTSGNTVPAGTYTIHYRVKSLRDVSDPDTTLPEKVGNKISVGDDDTCSSETWTKTTPGSINKQGQLVTGSSETYIDYTVYLNADGIIKNLKSPAHFSDTLPDSLELEGDVTVEQYDVSGRLVTTDKATVDGQTITYTTPTGQYYYIITYRTKVVDDKIPLGGKDIKNTATSTGGIEGESKDTTRVPNHALYKTFESQELQQNDKGEWVDVIRWQSRLMVKGNLKDYVYEDYGELMDDANKKHFAPLSMSDEQRAAIVITDANGDVVDSSLYTVEAYDRKGWNSDINVGLFRIEFTGDVTGPVTIEYETTANIWNLVEFGYYTFYNNGDLILGNDNDSSRAETDKIQYRKDSTNIIHKYGKNYDGKGSSKDVSLDAGENTLQWTIQLNEGNSLYEDLTVTDPMPEGLTLDPTTLKIKAGDANITSDTSLVVWSYENDVLTVQVKASAYSGTNSDGTTYSNAVLITYKTILPDSFLKGSEVSRTYVNTATVKVTGGEVSSTYTQEVTREVLNKFGSYDEDNQLLTYTIVINPDAATLNGGGDLTVTDHLGFNDDEYYTLLENITLRSLRLFTVYKTTNDNGDVICRPGRYVRDLDLAESGTALYTYTWNQSTGTFVTWLPDGTACILLAEYSVDDSNVSKDVHVKNEVEISAQSKWETKDDHTQIKKHTGGSTYTGDKLILTKHDREQYNKKLSGAVFSLQRYEQRYDPESQNWTEITILTTEGNQGNVSTDQIGRNTLYRLVETQAPSGYILDTTPSYFMITTTSQETAARAALPETISGDEYYSKDSVVVYTVLDRPVNANDVDDTRYYALVEIDCYNTKEGIEVILPETGSVGAQPFAAAGAGLMMVSASLMALRRRRR